MDKFDLLLKRFDEALERGCKEELLEINREVGNKLEELIRTFPKEKIDKERSRANG